jgi:hypothetical protein
MGNAQTRPPPYIYIVYVTLDDGSIVSIEAAYQFRPIADSHARLLNKTYRFTKRANHAGVFTCSNIRHIDDILEQMQISKAIPLPLIAGQLHLYRNIKI